TQRTLDALAGNEGAANSDLIVVSDGARIADPDSNVAAVRRYVRGVTGFRSVTIVEREQNCGLGNSIIQGVTQVLREHDRVIVVEADLVPSEFLLRFLNEALA